jgi:NLI interacting factor-like phosphatase
MKKTVCVDLDGTLATYTTWKGVDHIGEPRPGVQEFMSSLREIAKVVIYTTRMNVEVNDGSIRDKEEVENIIKNWLKINGIEYDGIYSGNGKPLCAAFVDDRAVSINTNPNEDDYYIALKDVRRLLE